MTCRTFSRLCSIKPIIEHEQPPVNVATPTQNNAGTEGTEPWVADSNTTQSTASVNTPIEPDSRLTRDRPLFHTSRGYCLGLLRVINFLTIWQRSTANAAVRQHLYPKHVLLTVKRLPQSLGPANQSKNTGYHFPRLRCLHLGDSSSYARRL